MTFRRPQNQGSNTGTWTSYLPVNRRLYNHFFLFKMVPEGNSLVVQWLRLCTPDTGGLDLIPGRGTRSHMPQLRFYAAK